MPKPTHMHLTQNHAPGSYVKEHYEETRRLMTSDEKFGPIKRSMKSKDDPHVRVNRSHGAIDVSVMDILAMLSTEAPQVRLEDVKITFSTITWEDGATKEEIADHVKYLAAQAERREAWERRTLAELTEKYAGA